MALVPIPARVTSSRMSLPTPSMHPVSPADWNNPRFLRWPEPGRGGVGVVADGQGVLGGGSLTNRWAILVGG